MNPYLNLLRRDASFTTNYFFRVLPDTTLRARTQQLNTRADRQQQEIQFLQNEIGTPTSQRMRISGTTGHSTSFGSTPSYFGR